MQLLNGKKLADGIRAQIRIDIQKSGITPGLAVLLVGNDPASHLYVSLKEKAAKEVGVHFEKYLFFATTPEVELTRKIMELNKRTNIHGILVQVPLPDPLSEDLLIAAIDPKKDADGFHPKNIEALLAGRPLGEPRHMAGTPTIVPSVIRGILALIEATRIPLAGKQATILANSSVFAAPLEKLLTHRGMNVQTLIGHVSDVGCQVSDVLITAIGKPHFLTAQMIKKDAIIIDVGTSSLEDGKIVGDAHPNVVEKASWLTPVPGGVGPMTVAYLLRNVVDATIL
ncbi:MAG: bifunctional methylenetetrahydrofolate dehydrogenase/methenyltetrahydrofolate cyclohydrolase [Candidatus Yonathbacteria bacterium]|nr:bifunctional methylenetetrahydrofolate dehydrogenase/methenyltetrahydrofolate cyclohydrolase [Candidatus Yonathbacteria bacterium]